MAQSIHTARWVKHLSDQGWDIHLFDFSESSVCPELEGVTTHTVHPPPKKTAKQNRSYSAYPFRRGAGFVKDRLPKAVGSFFFRSRVNAFVELYRSLRPDIVHSLEMQNESYPLLEARTILRDEFTAPWIYSSWGSDIYYYQDQPGHPDRIRAVLGACNYHIADCDRDVILAQAYGFAGDLLGVFPTAGSYDVKWAKGLASSAPPSKRRSIALKGYHHIHGRALVAIEALSEVKECLSDYTLEVYLAAPEVESAARELASVSGIKLKIVKQVPNSEIVSLMGRSRISVALSVSDGSPNSLLEAMMVGAFPIQSDTVSTAEWLDDGVNGFLVPPEEPGKTAAAIARALSDDALVDSAVTMNYDLMLNRVDTSINKPKIVELYKEVYRRSKAGAANHS